jgi:8-oxo-dGTP pyrophosphatase MutT (NUDIX family)
MEVFDLYDREFNKLNKDMVRGTENNDGEYHLVVHVWIRNKAGQYLIQQRNKASDRIPYQWACTAGAVQKNETSIEGAIRETKEEIGVVFTPSQLSLVKRYFVDDNAANYIVDCYLVESDILINEVTIDTVEVRGIMYKDMLGIKEMIRDNQFWDAERHNSRQGYLDLLEKR